MHALAGRQVSGMARAQHPADLPEGYHPPSQWQSWASPAGGGVEGCPRAVARSGCARSTGCRASPSVHKIKGRARHQKGTTRPGTGPYGVTRDGTATSGNGAPGYGRGAAVRIDTEAL